MRSFDNFNYVVVFRQMTVDFSEVRRLTFELPGTQQAPRSGIVLLRVRAERNVRLQFHRYTHGFNQRLLFLAILDHCEPTL